MPNFVAFIVDLAVALSNSFCISSGDKPPNLFWPTAAIFPKVVCLREYQRNS